MNTGLIAEVCTSLGFVVSLISELKRRNVFRMAALYLLSAWLIMQVAEVFIDLSRLPEWVGPAVHGLIANSFTKALVI
jgi:hypothetical protein